MNTIIKPFTFDDFTKLDVKTIYEIFMKSKISISDWATALKGYNEEVQAHIFASIEDTMAYKIYDEMYSSGLIDTSEMIEKQKYIENIVRKTYPILLPLRNEIIIS